MSDRDICPVCGQPIDPEQTIYLHTGTRTIRHFRCPDQEDQ